MPYKTVVSILLMVLSLFSGSASTFRPVVRNFTPKDYGASLDNWKSVQGSDGHIYVANYGGVLDYDGNRWSCAATHDWNVRAVFCDGDRIYAGGHREFGYFQRNVYGDLDYTSLSSGCLNHDVAFEEFWHIFKHDDKIWFQSFDGYYVYDGDKITSVHLDERPLYIFNVGSRIYAQIINGDFCRVDGSGYHTLVSRTDLADDNVVAVLQAAEGVMLLCTEKHGLYSWSGGTVEKFITEVDDELTQFRINRAKTFGQGSSIILGTLRNGLYCVGVDGRLKWVCNMANGLNDNNILDINIDRRDNAWICMRSGLALLYTGEPFTMLVPENPDMQFGMVYDIDLDSGGNSIYMATNNGAYAYKIDDRRIINIAGADGQNWYVRNLGCQQIFLGHNDHTKLIIDDRAVVVPPVIYNSGTCVQKCFYGGRDILIEGSYHDIRIYTRLGDRWSYHSTVENFGIPIRQIEVNDQGWIWVTLFNSGVFRFRLSDDLRRATDIRRLKFEGCSAATKSYVMKAYGQILLSVGDRVYKYDDFEQKYSRFTKFDKFLKGAPMMSISEIDEEHIWIATAGKFFLVSHADNDYVLKKTLTDNFVDRFCNDSHNRISNAGQKVWFPFNNAIVQYDQRGDADPASGDYAPLTFSKIYSVDNVNHITRLPLADASGAFPEVSGAVTFEISYPFYGSQPVSYRYTLKGDDGESQFVSDEATKTYSGLSHGDYRLTVEALNPCGLSVASATYGFEVLQPWYVRWYFILLYVVLLAGAITMYYRWRTAKTLKDQQKAFEAEKVKQQLKMVEQQRIIEQQRQQLLETEIVNKSKEISSLTFDIITRNSAADKLKSNLSALCESGAISAKEKDSILKHFDTTRSNNDFWDIYQKNFDLIHENFFKNLRSAYPNLSAGDLRLCAFLRLNMPTKDIAQVTNVSIRGVETARSRLRKKLGIDARTNLVNFLIDFN